MNVDSKLRVNSLMTANVVTVGMNDLLYDAIRIMESESMSALPVVDHTGKVCGILSNSDLINLTYNLQCDISALSTMPDRVRMTLTEVLAEDNCESKVRSVMTSPVETIKPNATITDAAIALINSDIHHLPVVDDIGLAAGMVSTLDIVRAVAFPLMN